eukprot:Hpha_TRINITY_DN14634_c0_g3::TRINITY_DN14634_c0_g3_i1::g.48450::m.48450
MRLHFLVVAAAIGASVALVLRTSHSPPRSPASVPTPPLRKPVDLESPAPSPTTPAPPPPATTAPSPKGPRAGCSFPDRPQTMLEQGVSQIFSAFEGVDNVTAWPVGGSLIHFLRHGRFSDYEEHDQEYDLDMAVTSGRADDVSPAAGRPQWVVDRLAAVGAVRSHTLTKKKSRAGTGTCRLRDRGHRIVCKHARLELEFDIFFGTPASGNRVHYAPLGEIAREVVHPMRTCRAWSKTVNCPAQPVHVLKQWGVGTGYEPKEGCLLLPRHVQRFAAKGEPPKRRQELIEYTRYLVDRARQLHKCGFASFHDHARELVCRADLARLGVAPP